MMRILKGSAGMAFTVVFYFLLVAPAFGQRKSKTFDATIYFVSGFKDRGTLVEVIEQGVLFNDGKGTRLIETSSIAKIVIKPRHSQKKVFIAGALAGMAGVGLTYKIQLGYGQSDNGAKLPVLMLTAGGITGAYFWLMDTIIQTNTFRKVNHPGQYGKYMEQLRRFSLAQEQNGE